MIFCARHIGNERSDATYAAVCEGRTHHDGRQYALRGDEPRCPKCGRPDEHWTESVPRFAGDGDTLNLTCGNCEHEYQAEMVVNYNFRVRA